MYRTRTTINCGYYYFFQNSPVGSSLKIVAIPLKFCGYKTGAVIIQERLMVARVRYLNWGCRAAFEVQPAKGVELFLTFLCFIAFLNHAL